MNDVVLFFSAREQDSGRAADLVAELLAFFDRDSIDMDLAYDEREDGQLPRQSSSTSSSMRGNLVNTM